MTTTESTTLEQLSALVENYYGLKERIEKLEKTKEMTEKAILDAFALTGMTTFTTPSGLVATINFVYVRGNNLYYTGKSIPSLEVSRSEAKKLSSHSLDVNTHFQNQG